MTDAPPQITEPGELTTVSNRRETGALAAILIVVAVLLTRATAGPSATAQNRTACSVLFDTKEPLYSESVSIDEGAKMAGRRARQGARLAENDDLKHALRQISKLAESRVWSDDESDAFITSPAFSRALFLCSGGSTR